MIHHLDTDTHTHTERERQREIEESESMSDILIFFGPFVSSLVKYQVTSRDMCDDNL